MPFLTDVDTDFVKASKFATFSPIDTDCLESSNNGRLRADVDHSSLSPDVLELPDMVEFPDVVDTL